MGKVWKRLFGQSYGNRVETEYRTTTGVRKAGTNLKGFLFGRKK